jgi:hypothetical protein
MEWLALAVTGGCASLRLALVQSRLQVCGLPPVSTLTTSGLANRTNSGECWATAAYDQVLTWPGVL